jgi:hypothetical protein
MKRGSPSNSIALFHFHRTYFTYLLPFPLSFRLPHCLADKITDSYFTPYRFMPHPNPSRSRLLVLPTPRKLPHLLATPVPAVPAAQLHRNLLLLRSAWVLALGAYLLVLWPPPLLCGLRSLMSTLVLIDGVNLQYV